MARLSVMFFRVIKAINMDRLIKYLAAHSPPHQHQHHLHPHPHTSRYPVEVRDYDNNGLQDKRQRRVTIAANDQDLEESSEQEDPQSSTDEDKDYSMPQRRRRRTQTRLGHQHQQRHVALSSRERRSGYPMSRYPYIHPHQCWMPTSIPYTHHVEYPVVPINARSSPPAPLVPVPFAPPFIPSPSHHQLLHSPYWRINATAASSLPTPVNLFPPF